MGVEVRGLPVRVGVLSFYHLASEAQTRVVRLSGKSSHPESHLSSPEFC